MRERSSRRRPVPPTVPRLMLGDLHPWQPPCHHGWHAAPGPRQGRRGLGARRLLRRRARNAPDQVGERRTVDGRDLASQPEAAPGIVVSVHHRAPQTESAKCTELGGPIGLGPTSAPGTPPGRPATAPISTLISRTSFIGPPILVVTAKPGRELITPLTRRPFVGPVQRVRRASGGSCIRREVAVAAERR